MKITHLKTNHLVNPLGYDLGRPSISYVVSEARGKRQANAQVLVAADEDFAEVIYDSGKNELINSTGFFLPVLLKPYTRYFWKVRVWDETGDNAESETAWFETGKDGEWRAKWIAPDVPKEWQMVVYTDITIDKPIAWARAYLVGLGVYEFHLNGEKQGEECLLPGFHDYDSWIQYQTFAPEFRIGENRIELALGDGWYKGVCGLVKKQENYGDRLAAIAEIHIRYEDGSEEVIGTDTDWKARKSHIVSSGIYPGEVYDATADVSEVFAVEEIDIPTKRLGARLSPPITVHERIVPVDILHTPKGETVLDMGQNMVGWLGFKCRAKAGTKLYFQFGELLQDGNFYRDNLRTAKAEFTYISDGTERTVRQHFTFYGYRFVKVTGWEGELNKEDFAGLVIHSDMEELGQITTSDEMVNRLIENVRWGMKGNFLDVPTDCPQRDERMGWTGDTQVFSGTACFLMDTDAFYRKYGHDVYTEQQKLNGSVPDVVPICGNRGDASTAWADVATIVPWNVYLHFGDKEMLRVQYDSMKAWVDYMKREDDADGGKRLWRTGFHYADWLALDGKIKGGVFGATEPHFIASGYYYHSATLVAKAAEVLGKTEDAAYYKRLAGEIREAFFAEYYTPEGRLAIDTMTAYVFALYVGLVPEYALERVRKGLFQKLQANRFHLETGFVGTPYLCRVLSENGMNDLAYQLLFEQDYPSWLYEVKMGATTIWERWNSVEEDGHISGTEMNSMNHYAYGSIVEWMYRNMLGIQPTEEATGFKRFVLAPKPDYRMGSAGVTFRSAAGEIVSEWKFADGKLRFTFAVPFDAEAEIVLPDADEAVIRKQTEAVEGISDVRQDGMAVRCRAVAGEYHFSYEPTVPYRKTYSIYSPLQELLHTKPTREVIEATLPDGLLEHIPFEGELFTLDDLLRSPFDSVPKELRMELDRKLREIEDGVYISEK